MRILKHVLTALAVIYTLGAYAQSDKKEAFAEKFETFKKTPYAKLRWTTSPDASNSVSSSVPMPNPIDVSKTHVDDPESGLRLYPHISKVLDPETGYYIEYDAHKYYMYRVNAKTGKIYKGSSEVEIKRRKANDPAE
ncbi:hypothetical protein POKO110462_02840 [Pontibacter korlensis]|uniref:PepSY domain-containing protein n=1 Tax=Pontibacter korlensis TaxID=400092 RepID=A0A0E3ZFQ4_9BACT|nr:hypothetical protein [Pontibacter korlensis]AKD03610.1 hypothetical protein PKOR_11315 [Pontibacter korlensis]